MTLILLGAARPPEPTKKVSIDRDHGHPFSPGRGLLYYIPAVLDTMHLKTITILHDTKQMIRIILGREAKPTQPAMRCQRLHARFA